LGRAELLLAAPPRLAFGALFLALFFPAGFRLPELDLALLAPDFFFPDFSAAEDFDVPLAAFFGVLPPLLGRRPATAPAAATPAR